MHPENIYQISLIPEATSPEVFETLASSGAVRIERIISNGQCTPPHTWLTEELNEWVLLIQGRATIEFADGSLIQLQKGDYINIPSKTRHKVTFTSREPHCIWLAVFYP